MTSHAEAAKRALAIGRKIDKNLRLVSFKPNGDGGSVFRVRCGEQNSIQRLMQAFETAFRFYDINLRESEIDGSLETEIFFPSESIYLSRVRRYVTNTSEIKYLTKLVVLFTIFFVYVAASSYLR
jgi:hypothetical protein